MDKYDNIFRLLRILRLIKMDKYIPSITLIDDVFRLKKRGLLISGFALSLIWATFATALWGAEMTIGSDPAEQVMHWRFRNVPNSLQYDMILLTGDYPFVDFTPLGIVVNVIQIFVAVGVVAVPSGIIAAGFTQVLKDRRRQKVGPIPSMCA